MKKQSVLPRKRMIVTAVALAVLLIFSVSITAYAMNSRTVLIIDDGEQITVTTTRSHYDDILRSRDIILDIDDFVDLSSFSEDSDGVIRIHRAKRVTLVEDGVAKMLVGAGSVQRLLDQNGIELGERDKVSYHPRDLLADGMEIVISRAFDIMVKDFGTDYSLTLTEGVVAQALELAGLTLEGEDFVEPAADEALEPGLTIHVKRVEYRERSRNSSIDFEVESRRSDRMDLGMSRVEQRGEKGEKRVVYSDRYINGERVDSIVLEEEILREPVKEIRIVGTRVQRLTPGLTPISTLTPPAGLEIVDGRPVHYREAVVGTAKAYHMGTHTASGVRVQPGYIAVDPRQFPYGTQLWVVSNDGRYIYGYAIAADTGAFVERQTCTIDLYMPNLDMCWAWGHRGVTIYVLDLPRIDMRTLR